jgi:hypothetical protein
MKIKFKRVMLYKSTNIGKNKQLLLNLIDVYLQTNVDYSSECCFVL